MHSRRGGRRRGSSKSAVSPTIVSSRGKQVATTPQESKYEGVKVNHRSRAKQSSKHFLGSLARGDDCLVKQLNRTDLTKHNGRGDS